MNRVKLNKQKPLIVIGVDPGIGGALSFFWVEPPWGNVCTAVDMPIVAKMTGKGNQVDAYTLCKILDERMVEDCTAIAYIEQVHAMPDQGVTGVFSFGKSCGVLEGIFAHAKIPVVMITPQKWKRAAGLIKKEKDAARLLAMQLFPTMSGELSRKKDVGRADALLIAHFGMRM